MDHREFLRQSPLFAELTDKELDGVLGTARSREFAAGDSIVREGDPGGRGFYLIESGKAEVVRHGVSRAELGPGDYFGEMALLLDDTPRTADVTALEDTRCLVMTQWDFRALLRTHPEISTKIMIELARRLRDTDQALRD